MAQFEYTIRIDDQDRFDIEVPDMAFPDGDTGMLEAVRTARQFAHYLADGYDVPLGVPVAVDEELRFLESQGSSPLNCIVKVVRRPSFGEVVTLTRELMDPTVVFAESVAGLAGLANMSSRHRMVAATAS